MDYHVGKTCPYCQYPIKHSAAVVICQLCKIPHHQACWDENRGCTTYGCQGMAASPRTGGAAERDQGQQDQAEWVDVELGADRGYRPEPAREGIAGRLILITFMVLAAAALFIAFYVDQTPAGSSSQSSGFGGSGSGAIRVPVDYATIQEAIDSAVDGQEIVVAEGVYSERINFWGKNIVLRSSSPGNFAVVQNTVIDGGYGGTTVTFENGENSSAVLNGFTITGGSGTRKQYTVTSYDGNTLNFTRIYGGGILVAGSSPTIINNNITGNSVNNASASVLGVGGGIAVLDGSAPLIEGNTIISNSAGAYGGGILIWYRASPTLNGNLIEANWAGDIGGGIMAALMSNPTISGNEILRNEAANWGGGLYIAHMSDASVIGNEIRQNEAGRGGGIFIRRTDSSLIVDNNIMHNKASGNGGGIYLDNRASATVEHNRIEINEAGSGGAIWVDSDSEVRLGSPDSNSYQGNKPNNIVRR